MSSLLDLPDELIVRTATYIDITDVCSLRQVCKRCFLLSHEREIWESILQSQANRYPLPRGLGNTTTSLEGQMKNPEELAISVHVTANSWRRHRGPALHFETQAIQSRDHIRHMHMILDRWLLVVSNKSYEVWDLYPSEEDPAYMIGLPTNWARGQMKPTCRLRKGPLGHIWSFVACADLSGDAIILAITCSPLDQNKTTTVQRLTFTSNVTELQLLGSVSDGPSRHPVVIDSNSYLAAIDSSSQLVAFKTDLRGNLLLWHWPTNSYWRAQPESTAADAQLVSGK
ncbi:hypothetical protein BC835DRAFT_487930 [Cytidiella melzeri]|nr:hypothetical protein BC835DRAFT_487930 [Cytidiella melzeri]